MSERASESVDGERPRPAVRLGAVSLDSADPGQLAAFWRDLLELEIIFESPAFVALKGAGVLLTMQQVEGYVAPTWPVGAVGKQVHLELAVEDIEAVQTRAVELGAAVPDTQPGGERWRVLLDPAGHPFCLTTMMPAL